MIQSFLSLIFILGIKKYATIKILILNIIPLNGKAKFPNLINIFSLSMPFIIAIGIIKAHMPTAWKYFFIMFPPSYYLFNVSYKHLQ